MRRCNTLRKQGQVAMEFMMVIGIATLIFVFVIVIVLETQTKLAKSQRSTLAEDLALSLRQQIQIAKESRPGYKHSFVIPPTIEGTTYTLRSTSCETPYMGGQTAGNPTNVIVGTDVMISMEFDKGQPTEVVQQVLPHKGTFIIGEINVIENQDGEIYLNKHYDDTLGREDIKGVCWCDKLDEEDCQH